MPTRKTTKAKETVAQVAATTAAYNEISYDTKMLIVIILLLFVYPIGLIFMWLWMNTWPAWVKIIITLPFLLAFVFLFFIIFAITSFIRDGSYHYYYYGTPQRRMERMRENMWNNSHMRNVTPTVFLPPKNTY